MPSGTVSGCLVQTWTYIEAVWIIDHLHPRDWRWVDVYSVDCGLRKVVCDVYCPRSGTGPIHR